ncbi:MAG TPA: hypothetical protein VK886_11155 [Vicinamibacterales bacterium]|nr:hypothetical protein [Vicinamibacterales bacterium]
MCLRPVCAVLLCALGFLAAPSADQPAASAQPDAPDLTAWREMRWRNIGPHRGGRGKSAVGIPDQPNVFFIGFHNGGVWKTTDYGRTWVPIFDDQPSGSVGAIAIAPSNPNIIYVGSGEGLQRPDLTTGDGIYRSDDGGKTWSHYGLRDAQQIPQIVVDPNNPDRLFVAALGHPYGPNEERGIFRSTDGGKSFAKVLYKGPDVGAADVALDPRNPGVVYAAMWEARQGPWENAAFTGPGSGLFKSIDGGTTWKPIGRGLPTGDDGLGRIGLGICDADPSRIYAVIASPAPRGGLYHSSDAGESWTRVNSDPRIWSREGDFHEVKTDPTACDTVYAANIASWKSVDGGKTFEDFRGAPGGDDYHRIWINPKNPKIIIQIADQGAIVTVNGGETWSSWYNQPTAQFYHVNTDNAFPYRVCGGQQESGSACVSSRGDDGQITFREWHPVGVEEYGYAVPDPLDPDVVYGGKITRYDRRTGQVQNISPSPLRTPSADGARGTGEAIPYRVIRTMPVAFSPVDRKTLFFASNTVWKTLDGGQSWTRISPDLSREAWNVPRNVGKYAGTEAARPSRRGVVYALAPSHIDINVLWAGTDDGLIHLTRDGGKTWTDVTPKELTPWAKVSIMDASHFDVNTAYAAVNTFRLDDLRPHIYRTRDGGKTWTPITSGIPDGGITNVVREDSKQRGLLFAGTEQAVYVSLDDGDSWRSLRLNMPATSIRDLAIKDDDLVVGTHGRSFWILDDVTPLRTLARAGSGFSPTAAYLFPPAEAWRARWNKNTDTPLPPDEPAGQNPPDGAIINYWLPDDTGTVTLEILDAAGTIVRRYESSSAAGSRSSRTARGADLGPASVGAIREPRNTEELAIANGQHRPEGDHFKFGQAAPPREGEQPVNFPRYWIRPALELKATRGFHRFVWDLHYAPPKAFGSGYPIAATFLDTAPEPKGPWAMPGTYTVRLTAGAPSGAAQTLRPARLEQKLVVRMDPRVKTPLAGLRQQLTLSMRLYDAIGRVYDEVVKLDPQAASRGSGFGAAQGTGRVSQLRQLHQQMLSLYDTIQDADVPPTTQVVSAAQAILDRAK